MTPLLRGGAAWGLAVAVAWGAPAQAQTERADSAFDAEDRALAERLYAQVLEGDPWNSRATYRLAVLRGDRPEEALRLFRRYTELEPDDPWGWLAVAAQLERRGSTDAAMAVSRRAAALAPDEPDVLALRGRLLLRAGRYPEALAAYRRAVECAGADDPLSLRRARWLEGEVAPHAMPGTLLSVDSDGNRVVRGELAGDVEAGGRARLGARLALSRVGDGITAATVAQPAAYLAWRPRADLRAQAALGVARLSSGAGAASEGEGELRIRWRSPGGHGGVEVRGDRRVLAGSPMLVAVAAVRAEVGAQVDVPVGPVLALRGAGRVGKYVTDQDANRRTVVRGGAVVHLRPAGEVSLQLHDLRFRDPTGSPYFAPREVRMVEAATYVEVEGDGPWMFVVDAGAGAQQVARHGEGFGGWTPAIRADVSATYALGGGSAVSAGVEAYDSRLADVITGTGASWRYLALRVGLRHRLR